jgi:hypothetical protein
MRFRGLFALIAAQLGLTALATLLALAVSLVMAGSVAASALLTSAGCWLGAVIALRPSGQSAALALWRLALGEVVKVIWILCSLGWLLQHPDLKPLGVLGGLTAALVGYALTFLLLKR